MMIQLGGTQLCIGFMYAIDLILWTDELELSAGGFGRTGAKADGLQALESCLCGALLPATHRGQGVHVFVDNHGTSMQSLAICTHKLSRGDDAHEWTLADSCLSP